MAGFQKTKPNTYKDLIAAAEYLQRNGYGSPATTAIQGRSAGGITVGMATTARPDLFRVVFNGVGDNNTLRAEHGTDGEANALEYGSTRHQGGIRGALRGRRDPARPSRHALSRGAADDGVQRPARRAFPTGQDGRAPPSRDEQWPTGPAPRRLRRGHGMGSTRSQRERELAEQLGFLYWQIGRPAYQPR